MNGHKGNKLMNLNKLLNKKKYPNILAKTFQVLVFISSGKDYITL